MDALSEALRVVQMTGAIFYDVACTAPWGFRVPALHDAAPMLAPGTDRLVNFHLIVTGEGVVRLPDHEELVVRAGDVVVLPHGDAHSVSNGTPRHLVDSRPPLDEALSGRPTSLELGEGGALTRIVCGFFGCTKQADSLFLAGLPRGFTVHLRGDDAGAWLEQSVTHLVAEAQSRDPGSTLVLARMAEVLFVEALRRYMHELPEGQRGWLAGARDPVVGAALALLHREPSRRWTLADLASEIGASRSVVSERFARYLDDSPLGYLTRWRLQLAVRELETTDKSVMEIASAVGYTSESAFNRAFKRELGQPPARFRRVRRRAGSD